MKPIDPPRVDAVNVVVSGARMFPITHPEAIVDCILRMTSPDRPHSERLFGRVNEGRSHCRMRVPADRFGPG